MRTKVLPPLVICILLLLLSFVYTVNRMHETRLVELREATAQRAGALVRSELLDYSALMDAALHAIAMDEPLRAAMSSRDRVALLARATPLFEKLHAQHRVDHFYFHAPDRTTFLRVHEPDHFGDVTNRFTLKDAQEQGRASTGIEQGPTGNCTLRVVHPWKASDGRLIGYLELGTEFETVAQRVHDLLSVELLVSVRKDLLSREPWEKRNKRLGRQTAWDDFPGVVVIDKTLSSIPPALADFLTRGAPRERFATIPVGSRTAEALFLPMRDVGGRTLGDLIVLRDTTDIRAETRYSILSMTIAAVAIGGALILFFYVFLGRVGRELDRRQVQLREANATLEQRVLERTEALEAAHKKLVDAAWQGGVAEMAVGVLHNVGNVMNSVNVSAGLIAGSLGQSKLPGLERATRLLEREPADLARYLQEDEKGRQLPRFLLKLVEHVVGEQRQVQQELDSLLKNVEHVKQIIAAQQGYAKSTSVAELVAPTDLMEDALRIQSPGLNRLNVRVERRYSAAAPAVLDKHKVLQILVNLIGNARQAMERAAIEQRLLELRVEQLSGGGEGDRLVFEVRDNGIGIPAEHMPRLFEHGFTTRAEGHGFGLHSAALAAAQMGGSLKASSDGVGLGAVFTLEIPFTSATALEAA